MLVSRELGFDLARIASLLDDPGVDVAQTHETQLGLVDERIGCCSVARSSARRSGS